jgi:hypothetical protein
MIFFFAPDKNVAKDPEYAALRIQHPFFNNLLLGSFTRTRDLRSALKDAFKAGKPRALVGAKVSVMPVIDGFGVARQRRGNDRHPQVSKLNEFDITLTAIEGGIEQRANGNVRS